MGPLREKRDCPAVSGTYGNPYSREGCKSELSVCIWGAKFGFCFELPNPTLCVHDTIVSQVDRLQVYDFGLMNFKLEIDRSLYLYNLHSLMSDLNAGTSTSKNEPINQAQPKSACLLKTAHAILSTHSKLSFERNE